MNPLTVLKSSPDRANELFAGLSETGPGAVKTRERLFQELKTEIELLARLEQDHLLPVLKKHAGTKTIVAATAERLGGLTTLLQRLDEAPKGGDDFLAGIGELKAAFQQHLRDEKGALLPKVQKALSDEEIATVAERIEADRAEVEATARHEAEVQRAEARRQREAEEARQAAAEAAEAAQREVRRVEREARALEREAAAAVEAAEAALRERAEETARAATLPVVAALATAQAGAQRAADMFGGAATTTAGFGAVMQAGRAYAQAARDASFEWMTWGQARTANRMSGFVALLGCRTPHEVVALQVKLVRTDLELSLATGARIAEIAGAASTVQAKAVASQA